MGIRGTLAAIGLSVAGLLLAGCVGGAISAAGALTSGALLGLALLIAGCNRSHPDPGAEVQTETECWDHDVCTDGVLSTRRVCCPEGSACNYLPVAVCPDGSCVTGPESNCPDAGDGGLLDASNDAAVDGGERCWDQEFCTDGVLSTDRVCCPAGWSCNYLPVTLCDDGSCVSEPAVCPDDCSGHWEQACEDGVVVELCCPEGLACNYGLGMQICDDGSCAQQPLSCLL